MFQFILTTLDKLIRLTPSDEKIPVHIRGLNKNVFVIFELDPNDKHVFADFIQTHESLTLLDALFHITVIAPLILVLTFLPRHLPTRALSYLSSSEIEVKEKPLAYLIGYRQRLFVVFHYTKSPTSAGE